MKSSLLLLFLSAICFQDIFSQAYFQQEVNYTIMVSLDDVGHTLRGFESIQYINNSPDKLTYLWFHLWPNAYKNNSTAFARQEIENGSSSFYFASPGERGFIDSLDFRVNGHTITCSPDNYNIDICRLILNGPLLPGDTIIITTPFFVKIPGPFSRFGHKGQAYQVSQWYPKPAVYDMHGWNQMPYLDQGEFYSEFGSYDVRITLPKNYVVGATGNLVTREELEWLEKKTMDTTAVKNFPASDKVLKSIQYKEKNIHDFAWFADKRYRVLKGEVLLPGDKKVNTWAMFTDQQAGMWKNAIEYINDAVRYYSEWYGDYPYKNCSAVYGALEAGGAMEYPTITVVGNVNTPTMLENFIMHEVGHNWFYGVLGFNERKYPFLDEGINTFSEFRYMKTKYPQLKLYKFFVDHQSLPSILNVDDLPFNDYYYYSYLLSARSGIEQPLNLSSDQYTSMNYGMIVYDKSALSWNYLLQYLGEEKFDSIMQQFYKKWQFRHPEPKDLRQEFEENCSEDLSWFFNDLLTTTEKTDYAVKRFRQNQVLVKNSGGVSSPLSLTSLKDSQILQKKWYPGFKGKQWLDLSLQQADLVVLFDSIWLPEINRRNNTLSLHEPLRKLESLNIQPFQIIEKYGKTSLGIFPIAGWNYYNKALLGVLLYNPVIPQQAIEYQLAPMYGFGNHDIAGMGKVSLNLYPNYSVFQNIQLSIDARRFGYGTNHGESYSRAGGELLITFKNSIARSPAKKTLKFGLISASELALTSNRHFLEFFFITMDANYSNHNVLNPYGINLNLEVNNDYTKTSLEVNYTHANKYAKNAVQVRFFASAFLEKESDFDDYYDIKLSGTSGILDYKYEHVFLGRFEYIADSNRQILLSQQFVMNEGGFASNNPFAQSNKWLTTIGFTWRIAMLPMYLFANAGTYSGAGEATWNISSENTIVSESLAYEAGVMINLGNFIRVYFPVITSHDISEVNVALTENYWQTIRYIIDFNAINPFKLKNRMF
jgi:hypothetical protein